MKIFKETMSYRLVTYLERFRIEHIYFNIVLFMFHFIRFYYKTRKNIEKYSNKELINLFFDIFKERLYLQSLIDSYKINTFGILKYNIINNYIICNINYDNELYIDIEYSLVHMNRSIFIYQNDTHFNVNLRNLKNEDYVYICKYTLYLIITEVHHILLEIFRLNIRQHFSSIFRKKR